MKKLRNHLKEEWYKYILEVFMVSFSIILAFELSNWNETRNDKNRLEDTYNLIAEEIKWDLGQVETFISELEAARPYFDKIIAGTLTVEQYKACAFCHTLSTTRYPIKSSYNGWKNLTREPHFQIKRQDTLNYILDDYYYDLNVRAAKEMDMMSADITENMNHFKFNAPSYYKLDTDPLAMMNFHLENSEYRNMLSIRRHFLYDLYMVTLKGLKADGTKALAIIGRKYPVN